MVLNKVRTADYRALRDDSSNATDEYLVLNTGMVEVANYFCNCVLQILKKEKKNIILKQLIMNKINKFLALAFGLVTMLFSKFMC